MAGSALETPPAERRRYRCPCCRPTHSHGRSPEGPAKRQNCQRPYSRVVVDWRPALNTLSIKVRVFFEQECVELTFALLFEAGSPRRRPDRMDHDRFGNRRNMATVLKQRELQIAVFAP